MLAEGWFCPACQAFHAPHVDTCEIAGPKNRFSCAICKKKSEFHTRCERDDCMTHVLVGGVASKEIH